MWKRGGHKILRPRNPNPIVLCRCSGRWMGSSCSGRPAPSSGSTMVCHRSVACEGLRLIVDVGHGIHLDNNRAVVKSTVNKIDEVSGPVDLALHGLSSVEDALGDIMQVNGMALYVLTFPLANRTFVYNIKQNDWTEWGQWDDVTGVYNRFRGSAYCYAPKWNLHLVGDHSNGNIYALDRTQHYDNGSVIRSSRRTGFISHGTGNKKHCRELRLRLKRSVATQATQAPLMSVKWRNDHGAWGPTKLMSLGQIGDHELMVSLKQCGDYRTRQYEFSHSDNTDWILMSGEEDVEVRKR